MSGLTLVQVCERLVVQLDSRRGGGAQHILEWGIFGLALRRKAGVLLLKDGQSQHIAERKRRKRRGTQAESQHGRDAERKHHERIVFHEPLHWCMFGRSIFIRLTIIKAVDDGNIMTVSSLKANPAFIC